MKLTSEDANIFMINYSGPFLGTGHYHSNTYIGKHFSIIDNDSLIFCVSFSKMFVTPADILWRCMHGLTDDHLKAKKPNIILTACPI